MFICALVVQKRCKGTKKKASTKKSKHYFSVYEVFAEFRERMRNVNKSLMVKMMIF